MGLYVYCLKQRIETWVPIINVFSQNLGDKLNWWAETLYNAQLSGSRSCSFSPPAQRPDAAGRRRDGWIPGPALNLVMFFGSAESLSTHGVERTKLM